MDYDYIVIHVVYWVELSEQRRLYLFFVKIWISNPQEFRGLRGYQRDSRIWGFTIGWGGRGWCWGFEGKAPRLNPQDRHGGCIERSALVVAIIIN